MGEKNARRFLPLIGTFAFFIFFSNCLALLPGFAPPTATLKTNLALALTRLVPGLKLFDIKCAWFNEEEYCEFFPRTLLAHQPERTVA